MNYNGYFIDKDGNKYFAGIVESGSNSNGNYVKFSDGTMICSKTFDLGDDINFATSYGSIYYTTGGSKIWTFPQIFKEIYSVNGSLQLPRGIGGVGFTDNSTITKSAKFYVYSVINYNFIDRGKVCAYLTAVGRWR